MNKKNFNKTVYFDEKYCIELTNNLIKYREIFKTKWSTDLLLTLYINKTSTFMELRIDLKCTAKALIKAIRVIRKYDLIDNNGKFYLLTFDGLKFLEDLK